MMEEDNLWEGGRAVGETLGQKWTPALGRLNGLEREGTDRTVREQALPRPKAVIRTSLF